MSKQKKQSKNNESPKSIRLWPGILTAALLIFIRFLLPIILPATFGYAVMGSMIFVLPLLIWWAFFSRVHWIDRLTGSLIIIAMFFLAPFILHESLAKGGEGMMYPILAIPIIVPAFVFWAILARNLKDAPRRITMIVTILVFSTFWALVKSGGMDDHLNHEFSWRWQKTTEQQLLDQGDIKSQIQLTAEDFTEDKIDWPGFRGSQRDGIVRGIKIETDWVTHPPKELWHKTVGPGWSSFAATDAVFFTQEQRGDNEAVTCYELQTCNLVWKHEYKDRFWESVGGAGPRGTPTIHEGRIYSLGANGMMTVLKATNGEVLWSKKVTDEDTKTKLPRWAYCSSPVIYQDNVIIGVAGTLMAYDKIKGELLWSHESDSIECYSSPHLLTMNGIDQLLFANTTGTKSYNPVDGTFLWQHQWRGFPIVQPTYIADGDILVSADDKTGVRRITIKKESDTWKVEEKWSSDNVKPYFNDSVIHKGFIYGYDGKSLTCVDLQDGSQKWKGGRYGRGQLILLADQDLLIVLSEKGPLALVQAKPEQFTELANIPAIKGKTWNHPVLVRDILLVRNSAEMAAFKLTLAE